MLVDGGATGAVELVLVPVAVTVLAEPVDAEVDVCPSGLAAWRLNRLLGSLQQLFWARSTESSWQQ